MLSQTAHSCQPPQTGSTCCRHRRPPGWHSGCSIRTSWLQPGWRGSPIPQSGSAMHSSFSQQSGEELARLYLVITPLCRQTGCTYTPKTPLFFVVNLCAQFPSTQLHSFFSGMVLQRFHISKHCTQGNPCSQGINWTCQLVPGNFSLGQWQWPLFPSPRHFLPTAGLTTLKQQYRQWVFLQRESAVIGPGLLCVYACSSFSLWMGAGASGRQKDCSDIKSCERGKSFHI